MPVPLTPYSKQFSDLRYRLRELRDDLERLTKERPNEKALPVIGLLSCGSHVLYDVIEYERIKELEEAEETFHRSLIG